MTYCLTDDLKFRGSSNTRRQDVLKRKKKSFSTSEQEEEERTVAQTEAKDSYSRKVEQEVRNNRSRDVWDGVRTITRRKTRTRRGT